MIDYPYVECSSASIQAISKFAKRFPDHPIVPRIEKARKSGRNFLKSIQKEGGSWYGSWAYLFHLRHVVWCFRFDCDRVDV